MHSDNDIVNLWLNRNGFFTITGISASNNRDIDIIAIKQKTNEVWHFEVVSSVTSIDTTSIKDITKRFNDPSVVKAVTRTISSFVGKSSYKKALVIGKTSKLKKFEELKDITLHRFGDVLFSLFNELDTHNYSNVSLRTLQLMKFVVLSDPDLLAKMLDKGQNILNLNTREQFLKHLMEQDETKRVLSKNSFEPELIKIIKNSTLNRPEKLAKALEEKILNKRTKKKFIETLLKYNDMKQEIKQTIRKDQKTLDFFK